MLSSIFELSKRLAVINRDNGYEFTITDRLDIIAEQLSETQYKLINSSGLFRAYAKKKLDDLKEPFVIVSSHIDCEENMTKCFSEEYDEKKLIGTYDNLITNTVILHMMINDLLPENVIVSFTGDEEENGTGAEQTSEFFSGRKIRSYVVLDVTYSGWDEKAKFTVENNFWDEETEQAVMNTVNSFDCKWKFVPSSLDKIPKTVMVENLIREEAMEDESWVYDEADQNAFSFCIPVDGEMHSNKGVLIRKKSLVLYSEVLQKILTDLA